MSYLTASCRLLRGCLLLGLLAAAGRAAEVMPPAPAAHFNDYAGVVDPDTAAALDRELVQFERDTSTQIVVALFPRMQSDSSIEDYSVRVAQSWGVGRKGRDNGAVLFAFMQDRTLYITTGYGLEGPLTDALCKRIIDREIVPQLRAGNPDAAFAAGVHALMAASRGEYRGTGRTAAEGARPWSLGEAVCVGVFGLIFALGSLVSGRRGVVYAGGRRTGIWMGPTFPTGGGGWGGGSSGGGFSGGGFSGGGGSFGGGGAGGSW